MLTPKGKSALLEKILPAEDGSHDAVSSRTASPTHYQLSYFGPQAGPNCAFTSRLGFKAKQQ